MIRPRRAAGLNRALGRFWPTSPMPRRRGGAARGDDRRRAPDSDSGVLQPQGSRRRRARTLPDRLQGERGGHSSPLHPLVGAWPGRVTRQLAARASESSAAASPEGRRCPPRTACTPARLRASGRGPWGVRPCGGRGGSSSASPPPLRARRARTGPVDRLENPAAPDGQPLAKRIAADQRADDRRAADAALPDRPHSKRGDRWLGWGVGNLPTTPTQLLHVEDAG